VLVAQSGTMTVKLQLKLFLVGCLCLAAQNNSRLPLSYSLQRFFF